MFMVLLGAPGAGKGTQASIVSQQLVLAHIASGDLFRQAVESDSKLGQLVKSYMEKGILVPDEVTIQMVLERINEPDCKEGCVFDGFPRTVEQAEALDKAFISQTKSIDIAIYIDVSEDELLKRLSGRWICRDCQAPYHEVLSPPKISGKCDRCNGKLYQRSDDTVETVKERLKVYFDQTTPVLDYYEKKDMLIRVNGESEIQKVAEEIIGAIKAKQVKSE